LFDARRGAFGPPLDARRGNGAGSYHGHERGGDLDEGHAPHVAGRREAHHVANYSTSERNESRTSIHARLQRHVHYLHDIFHCFLVFTIGKYDSFYLQGRVRLERLNYLVKMQRPHPVICHH